MSNLCEQCQKESEYNGWSNYATWGCKLILDSDQYCCEVCQDMARGASRDDAGRWELQQGLRDFVEELCGLEGSDSPTPSDMARQLLGAALCEVNWREIAESLLDDIEDEEEAQH